MTEAYFQKKIMDKIESIGGHVINGKYTRTGEADLQCGYPVEIDVIGEIDHEWGVDVVTTGKTILAHLCVEVKTPKDYERVMRAIDEDYNIIDQKPLKKHESVQMAKIRQVRKKGGLALVAYSFDQVKQYVEENV